MKTKIEFTVPYTRQITVLILFALLIFTDVSIKIQGLISDGCFDLVRTTKNKQNPYPQLSNLNSSKNVEDSGFVKLSEDGTKLKIHSQIKQPLPFLGEVPWSILVVLKFSLSLILLVLSIIDAASQIGLQFNGGLWSF